MSRRKPKRNNVIAGIFLVSGLVLAVVTSAVLSDLGQIFTQKTEYIVRFDISTGSGGMGKGSAVTLGGQKIGKVVGVVVNPNQGIDVRIAVKSDIVINENARASLVVPLLGAGGTLNFTNLGDPARVDSFSGAGPQLETGEVLIAGLAPPSFMSQAGFGPEQIATVRSILVNADTMMERVDGITSQLEERLPQVIDDVGAGIDDAQNAVRDVRKMTDKANARFDVWADQIDSTLVNANEASAALPQIVANADEGVTEARKVIASSQSMIDDAHPRVLSTLDSVESATNHFDTTTIGKIDSVLDDTQDVVNAARGPIVTFGTTLAEELPGMRKIFANLRLASDQAKLAMTEIRNSPWRVLYQPSRKEIEQELEFGSARMYATAVSDLRAASEALESLASQGNAIDQTEVVRLQTELTEAFVRYQKLEHHMLTQLAEAGGG